MRINYNLLKFLIYNKNIIFIIYLFELLIIDIFDAFVPSSFQFDLTFIINNKFHLPYFIHIKFLKPFRLKLRHPLQNRILISFI